MTVAEFFAQIAFKIEGSDELKAVESMLKNMAASAKATVAAVAELNGMKVKVPEVAPTGVTPAPSNTPQVPDAAPRSDYDSPIGPPVGAFLAYKQAIIATAKAKQQLIGNLKATQEAATKGAVAIGAFTAGLVALAVTAARTAQALRNFTTATGLSAEEMQRWSAQARILGADGQDMLQTVKAIQSNMARVALGEGDIAPFQFFGISPDIRRDTFQFLEELRGRIQEVRDDPAALAIVREMAARLGVSDDIFQSLLRQRQELDKSLFLSKEQVDSIDDMRSSWARVAIAIGAFKDKFVAAFAKPLEMAAKTLEFITVRLVRFVEWLNEGGFVANVVKVVIGGLIVALVALGGILTVVAGALGVVNVAVALLTKGMAALGITSLAALAPILLIAGKIALIIGAIAAVFAAAVLVIDDFWTAFTGGDSAAGRLGERLGFVKLFEWLFSMWDKLKETVSGFFDFVSDLVPDWMKSLFGGKAEVTGNAAEPQPMQQLTDMALTPRPATGGTTANQTNEIKVEVNGAQNPVETGREVANNIRQTISDAAYQMPVLSY